MSRLSKAGTALRSIAWRDMWRRFLTRLKGAVPFASGVCAALLALALYNGAHPPAQPLTIKQVNTAVAQAMASATPAPAFSARAYRAVRPSLVLIQTRRADENGEEKQGLGSGVVVSDQGEILTALHVVSGASAILVTFADGTMADAQIASATAENDIAVLQPDRLPQTVVAAVMGNPDAMRVGDEVYAVGNPFGLYGSLSAGVISGFDRDFETEDSDLVMTGLIQIDAAVNPGNSGGPLLNRNGQVIGIVIGVLNPTEDEFFVGVGFAVPITTAASGGGRGPQY
jgi:S1-C subfamily serine protease